jgi:hypothetical protein
VTGEDRRRRPNVWLRGSRRRRIKIWRFEFCGLLRILSAICGLAAQYSGVGNVAACRGRAVAGRDPAGRDYMPPTTPTVSQAAAPSGTITAVLVVLDWPWCSSSRPSVYVHPRSRRSYEESIPEQHVNS